MSRRAFSLVELLVVIALVAVLLSVLMPSLRGARNSARDATCLSNLRQLTAAWEVYTTDYRAFPLGSGPRYWTHIRFGWGGVHWYGEADETPRPIIVQAARPLNPYIGDGGERIETRMAVFRCPRDTGGALSVSGARTWDGVTGQTLESGDGSSTSFGVAGTSYDANEWMYCVPQDSGFFFNGLHRPYRNFVGNHGPHNVMVAPSRFVVLGDGPASIGGRYPRQVRQNRDLWSGFWHKDEHGQLGFLDGSARLERMGAVTTSRYTYYLNPSRHTLASKVYAFSW